MSRIHDVLKWANKTAVAEEVSLRGYRVSGETLNRWVRQDKEVPAIVERIVYELFTIGGHEEAPQPQWAGAMEERLRLELRLNRALIESDQSSETQQEIARMRAELHAQTPAAPPPDADGESARPHPRGTSPSSVR